VFDRFNQGNSQRCQSTSHIVDEYGQHATWRSPLEPGVRAAVELKQCAEPWAAADATHTSPDSAPGIRQ